MQKFRDVLWERELGALSMKEVGELLGCRIGSSGATAAGTRPRPGSWTAGQAKPSPRRGSEGYVCRVANSHALPDLTAHDLKSCVLVHANAEPRR